MGLRMEARQVDIDDAAAREAIRVTVELGDRHLTAWGAWVGVGERMRASPRLGAVFPTLPTPP